MEEKTKKPRPFIKWAGGKRGIMSQLLPHIPEKISAYVSGFLGGGALLFELMPSKAIIYDINKDLINAYRVIRSSPKELIAELNRMRNDEDYYYEIRALDRSPGFNSLTDVFKAARFIYLNKTGFNGLYRVNKSGFFNVPFGFRKNPRICDEQNIFAVHDYLSENDICIVHANFLEVLNTSYIPQLTPDTFIFCDPPYDYEDKKGFTAYTKEGFDRADQKLLCDRLSSLDCNFLATNNATSYIKLLYKEFAQYEITAPRAINRTEAKEVIIKNY